MSPREELKGMLEYIAGRALDNIEEFGVHLPVCFAHSPAGEHLVIVAESSGGGEVDLQACKESVLGTTRAWIAEGKIRAVAIAMVVEITMPSDDGEASRTSAVKIVLDHAGERGYVAFLTFRVAEGKAIAGEIFYRELPERFFGG